MPSPTRICSLWGCGRAHYADGLCRRDYDKWVADGRPRIVHARICTIDGCGKRHHAFGFCKLHYSRQVREWARKYRESRGGNFSGRKTASQRKGTAVA